MHSATSESLVWVADLVTGVSREVAVSVFRDHRCSDGRSGISGRVVSFCAAPPWGQDGLRMQLPGLGTLEAYVTSYAYTASSNGPGRLEIEFLDRNSVRD